MAALTADLELEMKDAGSVQAFQMVASKTIYKGSMVSIVDASGLAQASSDTSGDHFVGIAMEQITSAASGTYYIRCYTKGVFLLALTSVDVADQGEVLDVSDDQTCIDAGTNSVQVGRLVERVSTTSGWVDIGVGVTGSAAA